MNKQKHQHLSNPLPMALGIYERAAEYLFINEISSNAEPSDCERNSRESLSPGMEIKIYQKNIPIFFIWREIGRLGESL